MPQVPEGEEMSDTFVVIDVQVAWKPIALYLEWKWRRAGYRTAYQSLTTCTALVAAVLYKRPA
jgi:hypothetical protein